MNEKLLNENYTLHEYKNFISASRKNKNTQRMHESLTGYIPWIISFILYPWISSREILPSIKDGIFEIKDLSACTQHPSPIMLIHRLAVSIFHTADP